MTKTEFINYLRTISTVLTSFIFLLLPLFFLTNTTDFFILPKQVLLLYATLALAVLWGIRMVADKRLLVRANPFSLPVGILGAIVLASALFSRNMYDSLAQAIPFLFIIFFFFTTINTIDDKRSFNISLSSLVLGAVLSSIVSILYYLKIYFLPFEALKTPLFNTFGSAIQYLAYVIPVFFLSSIYLVRLRKSNLSQIPTNYNLIFQIVSSVAILAGVVIVILQIITSPQKPILLPYQDGFQIALASISQDIGRLFTGFLVGSGYGTFLTDFTRFRLPSFNQNPSLWNIGFSSSSSFVLEVLSTTGALGFISFLFLAFKILRSRPRTMNPLYTSLLVTLGMSIFIPFSYSLLFLFFSLLALYTAFLYLEEDKRVYNMVINLVALQEGLISFYAASSSSAPSRTRNLAALPIIYLAVVIIVGGFIGFYGAKFLISDMTFAKSLSREALANGQKTYTLQQQAILAFPMRADYYRVFSQVNLALANNVMSQQPRDKAPSQQIQQGILNLLQQSINSGRLAVSYAPLTASNWENLSQIYRALINVGQNAEQFSIASLRQAIALNSSNPDLYISLGGIYYQLGNYDLALNQFQIAQQLKPDLANAYYNAGHALEQKGQFQAALAQYLQVKGLVKDNADNLKKISEEIAGLENKIGTAAKQQQNQQVAGASTASNQPLEVNSAPTLPRQEKQIKISPPPITSTPTQQQGPTGSTPTAAPKPTVQQ